MVRAICGVQVRNAKRSMNLMSMLGLDGTIDQLKMASSVCWYGHVLSREVGHVLRRALDIEVEVQWKKGRTKCTCQYLVADESMRIVIYILNYIYMIIYNSKNLFRFICTFLTKTACC